MLMAYFDNLIQLIDGKTDLELWKGSNSTWIDRKSENLEEKKLPRAESRQSSPILDHPPKTIFTRGKLIQSSPIARVNRGVGNTAQIFSSTLCIFPIDHSHIVLIYRQSSRVAPLPELADQTQPKKWGLVG